MRYTITYGSRPQDVITLDLADITDATEIYNAAYAKLKDRQAAYLVLAAVHEYNFKQEKIKCQIKSLNY